MKRDVAKLTNNTYDLLVVGGGIYGACIAWDAVLRGLPAALVDRGDFGHATSANSLKIIHGGLRYLQDADLRLVREMIRERLAFMRVAPHLVHPLPCVTPTYRKVTRSSAVMRVALAINDLVGLDGNRLADPAKCLPRGEIISRSECLRRLPGIVDDGLTGGAVWHDCQMYNSERLTLAFVMSAARGGADVANYVQVTGFLCQGGRVTGVRARDLLADEEMEIRARVVVNAAGPSVDRVLDLLPGKPLARRFHPSRAMNIVTRQIIPKYAAGIPSRPKRDGSDGRTGSESRLLFIAPWREFSLIGTAHVPCIAGADESRMTEADVRNLVDEVNAAYPGAGLKREDVLYCHHGLLPMIDQNGRGGHVQLVRRGRVYDHKEEDGIDGLITVVGVKYTMARRVAEKVVDLVFRRLGKAAPRCLTSMTPVFGGHIARFDDFLEAEVVKRPGGLHPEIVRRLVFNYGSAYREVLRYIDEDPSWSERLPGSSGVTKAEVLHSVRAEMAQRLVDVILRRVELGSAGGPGEQCLRACAAIMAAERGWDDARTAREIDEVRAALATPPSPVSASVAPASGVVAFR